MSKIDIVIPVYNESLSLPKFHEILSASIAALPHGFRFIYVDDGSSDDTEEVLVRLQNSDQRVLPVQLSRNFGHQAAISAGVDLFEADALIMMDGDGEHPPGLLPDMIKLFESGFEVVQTQRIDQRGLSHKALIGSIFYRLINRIGQTHILPGGADFRLLSRGPALALRKLPEYHRFYRGMVPWLGFRSVVLPYSPSPRIAGRSKYSLSKMFRLAADGLFSFSLAPLRFGILMGSVFLVLAIAEITYVMHFWIRGDTTSLVPGWSSLMIVLTVSSAITMFLLGILGFYVGMIFQEVKHRPVYLVRSPLIEHGDSCQPNSAEPGE